MPYVGAPALKAKGLSGALIGFIGRKKYGGAAMGHASALGKNKGHSAAAAFIKGLRGDGEQKGK